MKKLKPKQLADAQSVTEETEDGEILNEEMSEVNSIQEFIELKKLQNRILEKMIEKLNTTENHNKPNNK
jgi:hypothetical protein